MVWTLECTESLLLLPRGENIRFVAVLGFVVMVIGFGAVLGFVLVVIGFVGVAGEWFGVPVLGNMLKHVLGNVLRHVLEHMLGHMPGVWSLQKP